MEFSAAEIAGILQGEVQGNPDVRINKLAKIEQGETGSLSFLANPRYTPHLYSTAASVVIVDRAFAAERSVTPTLIRVDDPRMAFSKLLAFYNRNSEAREGIEQHSFIADSAVLGDSVYIGAFAYIAGQAKLGDRVKIHPNVYIGERVVIGADTELLPGVKIYPDTVIGAHCILHSNAVIGSDGFGFVPGADNQQDKMPQTGNVVIGDFVEVGAGTTVDRATLGSTILRRGVKLDNQIQIGHNVEVGAHTVIASQVGVAGSTKIGEACMIGGQVGIAGHLTIGNRVRIAAQSGITSNVPDDAMFFGSPAMEAGRYRKSFVYYRNLPAIVKRLEALEAELRKAKTEPND